RRLAFVGTGPDGKAVLWVRDLQRLETRVLSGEPSNTHLVWSPDSRFIAFPEENRLRKVDVSGGKPQTICTFGGSFRGAAWSRQGMILIGSTTGLFHVSQDGGTVSPLADLNSSQPEGSAEPVFLTDQRHFLYTRNTTARDRSGIYMGSLDLKPEQKVPVRVLENAASLGYAPSPGRKTGHVFFLREGTLMVQQFDEEKLGF